MKRRMFAFLICICLIVATLAVIPTSAEDVYWNGVLWQDDKPVVTEYNADTYYYDRINDRAKIIYDYLKDYYMNVDLDAGRLDLDDRPYEFIPGEEIIPGMPYDYYQSLAFAYDCFLANDALAYDFPKCALRGMINSVGGTVQTMALKIFTDEELLDARIQQIVDTVGEGDRYTKLRKLVSYFMDTVVYDGSTLLLADDICNGRLAYDVNAYGTIVNGVGICDGMSRALKILCDELDIPCIIVGSASHGWNRVLMDDGRWYDVDLTNVCPIGQGSQYGIEKEYFFAEEFLCNKQDVRYDDPYNLALNNIRYVTDFPEVAPFGEQYVYTGDTTDFSFVLAPMQDVEEKYQYRVNDDGKTCVITHFSGNQQGDLVVPQTIDGYTVTGIEKYAYYYCVGFDGDLYIPSTVRYIGECAFAGCCNIKSIKIENGGVDRIDAGAFMSCNSLTDIDLTSALVSIADYAFYDCKSLNSVTMTSHVYSIGKHAFFYDDEGNTVLLAPSGSYVEGYAEETSLSFVASGELCVKGEEYLVDVVNQRHYRACDHMIIYGEHDALPVGEEYIECGSVTCRTCGAQYCNTRGYIDQDDFAPEHSSVSDELIADARYHYKLYNGGCYSQVTVHDGTDSLIGFVTCGSVVCETCQYVYCAKYGFVSPEVFHFTYTDPIPADCHNPEYTGDKVCFCGMVAEYGRYVGELGDHILSDDSWNYNAWFHYKLCVYGCQMETSEHTGGVATLTERARCEVCGAEYGDFASEDKTVDESLNPENTETEETGSQGVTEEGTAKETGSQENTKNDTAEDTDVSGDANSGCGSTLGNGAILLAVMAIGAFAMAKHREE